MFREPRLKTGELRLHTGNHHSGWVRGGLLACWSPALFVVMAVLIIILWSALGKANADHADAVKAWGEERVKLQADADRGRRLLRRQMGLAMIAAEKGHWFDSEALIYGLATLAADDPSNLELARRYRAAFDELMHQAEARAERAGDGKAKAD